MKANALSARVSAALTHGQIMSADKRQNIDRHCWPCVTALRSAANSQATEPHELAVA